MPSNDDKTRANAAERDPRFQKFAELYVELHGNAYRAACQAGYTERYAKSKAHKLAARLRLKAGPVLRRYGLDEVFVARKLKKLARAKRPKWNPATKQWDRFEDAGTQLGALQVMAKLLEMEPPKTVKGEGPDGAIPVVIRSSIARPVRAPGLEPPNE